MADDILIPVTTKKGAKKQIAPSDLQKALDLGATIDGTTGDGLVPMVTAKGAQKFIAPIEVPKALGLGATFAPLSAPAEPDAEQEPAPVAPVPGVPTEPAPEAHTGALDKARTYFEGLGKGAALGSSAPMEYLEGASTWIGNKAYELTHPEAREVGFGESLDTARRDMGDRAEANPLTNAAGQVSGIVLPALATGGTSGLARGAALTPSGIVSQGASRAAAVVGRKVAAETGWKAAGTIANMAVQGAVEGGAYAAVTQGNEVDKAISSGDWDGVAEKVMAATGEGAMFGAGLSVAAGTAGQAVAKGAGKIKQGAVKLINEADLGNFAARRAYKQALGGRNLKALRQADKYLGGPEAVGRTLMREGVVTPSSTVEEIAESAGRLADERGALIGNLVGQFDEAGAASRKELLARVERDVLAPLRKTPTGRAVAEGVAGKVGAELDDLATAADDTLSLRELWERRVAMDKALGKWQTNTADVSVEGVRDVIRAFRGYFDEMAEKAAKAAGKPQLKQAYDLARQEYGHLRHAEDAAKAAIQRDTSNRFFSLTDYMTGLTATAAQGEISPETIAYGFLTAAANKYARKQLSGLAATAIDKVGQRSASKLIRSVDVMAQSADDFAGAATKAQERLNTAAGLKGLLTGVGTKLKEAIPQAVTYQGVNKFLADLDPNSEASQELYARLEAIGMESPELADYIAAKHDAAREFILAKAGPEPLDMFGRPTDRDPQAKRALARYATAIQDPVGALERIGEGKGTDEDREALQAVFPRTYQEFIEKALEQMGDDVPYKKRIIASHALGIPTDSTMDPGYVAFVQRSALDNRGNEMIKQGSGGAPNIAGGMETRADGLINRAR
jgi:hypothetical protein